MCEQAHAWMIYKRWMNESETIIMHFIISEVAQEEIMHAQVYTVLSRAEGHSLTNYFINIVFVS